MSAPKMSVYRALVGLALIVCVSTHADDLCQAKEVRKIKQESCQASLLPYRNGVEITIIEVATIATGWKTDFDLLEQTIAFAVRTKTGKIERLRVFPYFSDAHPYISATLGFQQFGVDPNIMYESTMVEMVDNRYCATYIGKFPFAGEATDCGDRKPFRNTMHYADGVTSASDARKRICSIVEAETSDVCGGSSGGVYSNVLTRSVDGLSYKLMARIRVRAYPELEQKTSYGSSTPVEYDKRIYEVGLTGDVTLLEQSRILCGSRGCKPLESGRAQQSVPADRREDAAPAER
jgi:hypothetical protein